MRGEGGRFAPGHAPLPGGGRPRGLTQAEKVRALLEPHREELIGVLMNNLQSEDGHVSNGALRLALEYLAPKPKAEDQAVEIPGLSEARSVAEKAACVANAVGSGLLSPERAEKVMRMLDILQRSVAIDELRKEVEALKGGHRIIDSSDLC